MAIEKGRSVGDARVAPLPRSEWTTEIVESMAPLSPPDGSAVKARRSEMKGSVVVNALATLLRHPALAGSFFHFNRHLLYESLLSERERELTILRVARIRGCDYEWAQHVAVGAQVGIDDDEIDRLREPDAGDDWSAFDSHLLRAVDELLADARISDATWAWLREEREEKWLMDLVFTVGGYETLAMAFNSFGIALDSELEEYL